MKQRQCTATTKAGERCKSWAMPESQFCISHGDNVTELAVWRQKGGEQRSNVNRARKRLTATSGRLDVAARVLEAMRRVEAGEMEPGPASAIASLARAYITVIGDSDLQDRLDGLQRMIEELKAS